MTIRSFDSSRTRFLRAVLLFSIGSAASLLGQTSREQQDFDYGERLFREGLYEPSAIQFESFSRNYPASPRASRARWMNAESLVRLNRFDEAREAYLGLILRYPDAGDLDQAHFRMAECFERSGQTAAASQSYWQLHLIYPQSRWAGESLLRCASLAAAADSLDRAEAVLRELTDSPDHPESRSKAVFLLADVLSRRNRPDESIRLLQPFVSRPVRDPDRPEALLRLGILQSGLGDWDPAKERLAAVLASPTASDSLKRKAGCRLGRIEALLGENGDACRTFQSCLGPGVSGPDADEIRWRLGIALAAGDRPQEALQSFLEVDPAGPWGAVTAFESAGCLVRIGAADEAEGKYAGLAESGPPDLRGRAILAAADLQCRRGAAARASASFGRFLAAFPDDPAADRVLLRKAVVDIDLNGRLEEGFHSLEQLWNGHPSSALIPESQYRYACALQRLGRVEECRLLLRRLMAQHAFSPWADSAGSRLEAVEWTTPIQGPALSALLAPVLGAAAGPDGLSRDFELGLFHFDALKDYSAAQTRFTAWLRAGSSDSARTDSAWFLYGECHFRRAWLERDAGRLDSALFCLEKMRPSRPLDPLGVRSRLMGYRIARARGLGNPNRWIADLPPSPPLDPVEAFRFFSLARSAFSIDSTGTAGRILDLLPERPADADAAGRVALLRAMIELKSDRPGTADSLLERLAGSGCAPSIRSAAFWFRGRLAEAGGRMTEAAAFFREASDAPFFLTDGDSVLISAGHALMESGEPAEAARVFETALLSDSVTAACARIGLGDAHPGRRPALLRRLAEAYAAARETGRAAGTLLRYGTADPSPAGRRVLWTALSSLSESERRDGTARYFLSRLAEMDASGDGLEKLAALDFRLERYEDAAAEYGRAAEAAEDEARKAELTAGRISALFRLDRLADGTGARQSFESRFKGVPAFREIRCRILMEQGKALVRDKSFDEALRCFEDVADEKKSPLGPWAELETGRVLLLTNKTDRGLDQLTDLVRRNAGQPIVPEIYLALGEHYGRSGQPDNAVAAFKKALADSLNPRVGGQAASSLIRLYEGLQMTDAAIALTKRYLERFPDADDAFAKRIRLGIYYYELKEFDRAIGQLRSLQSEAEPGSEAEIQYWIGKCYAEMGRFDDAIFEFLKVKYLCPATKLPWASTALYEAGMAYLRLQRPDPARQMFTRIVQTEGASSDLGRIARQRADEIDAGRAGTAQ
jgi:tetratricopeptide (TPR) repeat protein